MHSQSPTRIGVDFGGVIVRLIDRVQSEDSAFVRAEDRQAAHDGAVDGVRQLVEWTDGQVWIVSKAGPRMQANSLAWLEATSFYESTGLSEDHVHFCRERQGKAPICAELGITHFIDDRVNLMQILRGTVPNLFLFGPEASECPSWATPARNWTELLGVLRESMSPSRRT